MQLSLSVRIVEDFSKTRLHLPLDEFLNVAVTSGYPAICMRASAAGVETDPEQLAAASQLVRQQGLFISMVTADYDVPLNNEHGPKSLRNIGPSLDVAEALGCDLIRVCMKVPADVEHARRAARLAAERGIRIAHQCHTSSLFEQVDAMLEVIADIDHPNFGIIYEPANLLLCGESYGLDTLERLRPHLMNVYVQNHRLDEGGSVSLPTYCRGDVRFEHLDPWDAGGVDFDLVCDALKRVGYDGTLTIHQAQGIETAAAAQDFADRCCKFFEPRL